MNFTGIEFPVKLRDINRFDRQNEGIAVNLFGLKDTKVYPLRISEMKNREEDGKLIIDFLMIKEGNQHYCLIKNIGRLLSKQVTKRDGSFFFCRRGLSHFPSEKKLAIHDRRCSNNEAGPIVMPEVNDEGIIPYIKFKNHNRFVRVPFVIYDDFE